MGRAPQKHQAPVHDLVERKLFHCVRSIQRKTVIPFASSKGISDITNPSHRSVDQFPLVTAQGHCV